MGLLNKILVVMLALVCSSQIALAETKGKTKTKSKKQQVISFDDELIQGEAQKPELFYLLQRKQYNFKKLIRLRENFLPEMRRSSEVLRRGGE